MQLLQTPKRASLPPLTLLLVIFTVSQPTPSYALIEDVMDVIHVVKEVTSGVLKAWDIVQSSPLASKIDFPLMREKQRKVLQRLHEVSRQIDQTEAKHAHYVALAVESVSSFVSTNAQLMAKMNVITDTMNRISSRYQQMQSYEMHKDQLEMSTLITFAEWTVAPNAHSVHHLMDRLHLTLIGGNGNEQKQNSSSANLLSQLTLSYENTLMKSNTIQELEERAVLDLTEEVLRNDKTFSMSRIFQEIEYIMVKQTLYYRAMMASADEICNTKQSAQQFVYSLYTDIALTELKGYIMMEFSWMMLRVFGKGNFSQESELNRRDYEKRTERTLKLLKEVMRRADRIVWRCDPSKYVHNVTYDEVTRLLQGYVENEVDMNPHGTCRENCGFYQITRNEGCYDNEYCARQPKCFGRLYSCQYIDSDMWVCPSAQSSARRYEYIEYENGRVLGQRKTCTRGTTKVDSWWRFLWHCSYCFCLCDEQGVKSDRYFNLRESVSDVKQNKVVTGLRFIKKNRVFHLQIQQAELLPRGAINESTVEWKPVDEYKIFDRNVAKGVDYHTLSYESRSIDLDDIMRKEDNLFVITGVRFRVLGAHLNLEARLSEYDFKKGELNQPEVNSFWESNDNTDVSGVDRRQKLNIFNADVSTRTIVSSLPQSSHNQYVDFVNTGLDNDAAQSTVPFIDIQEVISNPPVPLSGVGIYYKGRHGYGGFVAPKIITYDFTPHVQLPKSIS